jgi:hypothetical protein
MGSEDLEQPAHDLPVVDDTVDPDGQLEQLQGQQRDLKEIIDYLDNPHSGLHPGMIRHPLAMLRQRYWILEAQIMSIDPANADKNQTQLAQALQEKMKSWPVSGQKLRTLRRWIRLSLDQIYDLTDPD